MSLAKKITQAREQAGLSQAELAKKLGKSRSSVNEYEAGEHTPRPQVLAKISKITGFDLGELLAELAA